MKKLLFFCFGFLVTIGFSQTIGIQSFATGFTKPVEISHPVNDSRLFIVEQGGKIKVLNANGTTNAAPFLDVATLITTAGNEQGLLGLAFDPNYASNGFFYINYTNTSGNTVIAKYSVSSTNLNVASSTATILLTIPQPFSNHNGGSLKFGPDGFLYIGMGDGGSGGDPGNRAQNYTELLGKLLRINVSSGTPYSNPSTNPYVGIAGADEIWAIGFRNPWKFSFNRNNGDLWIADVGQDLFEEINKATSPLQSGLNFGWRCKEGNSDFNTTGCSGLSLTAPIAAIDHNSGSCSITGGYVYTGSTYPSLQGKYLFTDYCNPKIGIVATNGSVSYSTNFSGNNFVTFGEDKDGELYVAAINNGTIYKIIDSSLGTNQFVSSSFRVYPNPSKNEVYIEKNDTTFPIEITIFNINGKKLWNQKTENISKNSIDTSFLKSGLYLMNIKTNEETTFTHKLVIE